MHAYRLSEWHTLQGEGSVEDATPTEDPGAACDEATGADNSGVAAAATTGNNEDSQHPESDAEASGGAMGKQPGTGDAVGRKNQGDFTAPDTGATPLNQVCFKGLPQHR